MPDPIIAELDALRAAATPGEWEAWIPGMVGETWPTARIAKGPKWTGRINGFLVTRTEDAEAIVALRNKAPAILAGYRQAIADVRTLLGYLVRKDRFYPDLTVCHICGLGAVDDGPEEHREKCPIPDIKKRYGQEESNA